MAAGGQRMPPWSLHGYPGKVEGDGTSGPDVGLWRTATSSCQALGHKAAPSAHLSCAEVNASVHRHVPHGPACQQSQGEVLWPTETAAEDGTAIWGEKQREVPLLESKSHCRPAKDALSMRPFLQLTKRTTLWQRPQKRKPHSHLLVDSCASSKR